MSEIVRIGCGGGFWGDSDQGPIQLVEYGEIDFLVMDYLAEITMSLLARARVKQPDGGYPADFVTLFARLAPALAAKRIRVVANAGGVNPAGCRDALQAALDAAGIPLKVAAVTGDDLLSTADRLRGDGITEMATGAPLPAKLLSMNAYLGALPIAAALDAGADIVITGRCVDSAVVLGPLIHRFGWTTDQYDLLAAGSLAGHVVECGTQATGGVSTDWEDVPGWDRMGYPIVECHADGSFVMTKPPGTGGLVNPATVAEQIIYEIGDPARYILPDVICDFRHLKLTEVGPDRVLVEGAKGLPPTRSYKASATYADGFKCAGQLMIGGRDAAAKARRTGEALLKLARRLLAERGLADFRRTSIEVLGADDTYGPAAFKGGAREVILKVAVDHAMREGAEILSREFLTSATGMAQGITGFAGGRPKVTPMVRLYSCLVDKNLLSPILTMAGVEHAVTIPIPAHEVPAAPSDTLGIEAMSGPFSPVPLIAIAYGRSGDKGDDANIGVLARDAEFVPAIAAALTPETVHGYFAHLLTGTVERFALPGLLGFNFLLHGALDGGGTASLRHDPQGKAFAQMLMDFPVPVPTEWLARHPRLARFAEPVRL
ncbi:MAG TPA: acyclic terpene utilization AtuA family protein [Aliidongia sp.]|uniref:acyclic terpene utilization AtuA family protein n=1 Tax=Aliidongia sp. TaxID=1914230 RepID=UPI002DDCF05C|nr:acyclic terpene utilization AtuA family protein [Aliidongia sp.]HEV2674887.1 acyclic terpene utilization AtuA family protein [Aliidongia sp.]